MIARSVSGISDCEVGNSGTFKQTKNQLGLGWDNLQSTPITFCYGYWMIRIREHSHMTSDVFGSFLTYLPTLIRYHHMWIDLPKYVPTPRSDMKKKFDIINHIVSTNSQATFCAISFQYFLWIFYYTFRVSVQGFKSFGGHFACLCSGLNFLK